MIRIVLSTDKKKLNPGQASFATLDISAFGWPGWAVKLGKKLFFTAQAPCPDQSNYSIRVGWFLEKFTAQLVLYLRHTPACTKRLMKTEALRGQVQTCSMPWGDLSLNVNFGKTCWYTVLLSIAPDSPCYNGLYDRGFLSWKDLNPVKIGNKPPGILDPGFRRICRIVGIFVKILVWWRTELNQTWKGR